MAALSRAQRRVRSATRAGRGGDPESITERAEALATTLARRWESDSAIERVCSTEARVNTLKGKALQDLSPGDLITLRRRLEANRDLLADFAASPTLWSLSAASEVRPGQQPGRDGRPARLSIKRVLRLWQSVDSLGQMKPRT
jgi:hypothetical protein